VTGSVVGPGCRVGAGATVSGSVLLEGAVVTAGRTVENLVMGNDGEPVW